MRAQSGDDGAQRSGLHVEHERALLWRGGGENELEVGQAESGASAQTLARALALVEVGHQVTHVIADARIAPGARRA